MPLPASRTLKWHRQVCRQRGKENCLRRKAGQYRSTHNRTSDEDLRHFSCRPIARAQTRRTRPPSPRLSPMTFQRTFFGPRFQDRNDYSTTFPEVLSADPYFLLFRANPTKSRTPALALFLSCEPSQLRSLILAELSRPKCRPVVLAAVIAAPKKDGNSSRSVTKGLFVEEFWKENTDAP